MISDINPDSYIIIKYKEFLFKKLLYSYLIMDIFTQLFWFFSILFVILSIYLLCCNKKTNIFFIQIGCGVGMFITSKIGRTFLRLE